MCTANFLHYAYDTFLYKELLAIDSIMLQIWQVPSWDEKLKWSWEAFSYTCKNYAD